MSIIEIFKMIGDTIDGFVSWKGSGIFLIAFVSIPVFLFALKLLIEIYGRFWYEEEEKTEDNDR